MSRLPTAIGLLAIAFYLVFFAPQLAFYFGAAAMSVLCYREYSGLVAGHGIGRPGIYGLIGGLLILFVPVPYELLALTLLVISALIAALRDDDLRHVLPQVACVVLGAFYSFAPWRFSIELRAQSVHLLFFALALNWAGDSIAYYVGRSFGKHKLAPIVSPKKSWEGAVAAVVGSVVFGLIYLGYFLPSMAHWKVAVIAIVANIGGQLGDLAESAMKRGAGVKDSGKLLPGHGGMLDRVDSSLFALPIVYGSLLALRNL